MIRLLGLVGIAGSGPLRKESTIQEDSPGEYPEDDPNGPSNVGDDEGNMARAQLLNINKQTAELYNLVGENDALEAWVQDKLSQASDFINVVHNYIQYEKKKPNSIGDGDGSPADSTPMGETVNPEIEEALVIPSDRDRDAARTLKQQDKLSPDRKVAAQAAASKDVKKENIDTQWVLTHYMENK